MKLTSFGFGSDFERGTELVDEYKVLSKSSSTTGQTYLLLESVIVKGVLKIDEAKEEAHGCKHALADVVSLIFQSTVSLDCD